MIIQLGNSSAVEAPPGTSVDGGDSTATDAPKPIEGDQITEIVLPDDLSPGEVFSTIDIKWGLHAAKGSKPTWVDGTNPGVVAALSGIYGCPIGAPKSEEPVDDES